MTSKFPTSRRSTTDTTHWNPSESHAGKVERNNVSPTSSITENSASVNVLKLAQGWQQKQKKDQECAKENQFSNIDIAQGQDGGQMILDPPQLYQNGLLSDDDIDELFIETIFYARLGFVQPPCCLLCTYKESMDGATPNQYCSRWVIWRRNAETPLHPNMLENNIVITYCSAARSLLKGETVNGHAWDKTNKKLVLCCTTE